MASGYRWKPAGLYNPHNWCFLNTALQCIGASVYACQPVTVFHEVQFGDMLPVSNPLVCLFDDLWIGGKTPVNPWSLIKALRRDVDDFRNWDNTQDDMELASSSIVSAYLVESGLFAFHVLSTLRCFNQRCLNVSNHREACVCVNLSLGGDKAEGERAKAGRRVLQMLFDRMFGEEVLPANNEWKCCACDCKTPGSTKRLRLSHAPRVLTVQLARFACKGLKPVKLATSVDYPETFHPGSRCGLSPGQAYRLQAVGFHQGVSFKSGHFYACVNYGGEWFSCDDSRVEPLSCTPSLNPPKGGQAYMLYYVLQSTAFDNK